MSNLGTQPLQPVAVTHEPQTNTDAEAKPKTVPLDVETANNQESDSAVTPTPFGLGLEGTQSSTTLTDEDAKPSTATLDVQAANSHESDSTVTPTPLKLEGAQSSTTPIGLDSLLSPKDPDAHFPLRESIAASEATDEDSRFSTVLLSARQSMEVTGLADDTTTTSTLDPVAEDGDERRNTLSGNDLITMVHRNRVHKKTASTSTIVSANNVPFILSRLDAQMDEEKHGSNRSSLDGQQKLQEDFSRLQLGEQQSLKPAKSSSDIDWGKESHSLNDNGTEQPTLYRLLGGCCIWSVAVMASNHSY